MMANLYFERKTVAETEDTITFLDGNGVTIKRHKHHDSTPEHVNFSVTCYEEWEEKIKPLLKPERRRIDFEGYKFIKARGHGWAFFVREELQCICIYCSCLRP